MEYILIVLLYTLHGNSHETWDHRAKIETTLVAITGITTIRILDAFSTQIGDFEVP